MHYYHISIQGTEMLSTLFNQKTRRSLLISRQKFYSLTDEALFCDVITQIPCIVDCEKHEDDIRIFFQEQPLEEQDMYDIAYLCKRYDIESFYFAPLVNSQNREYFKLYPYTKVFQAKPDLACDDPAHTPYRLTCKEVVFYTQPDASAFFNWIDSFNNAGHSWGEKDEIYFHLKSNIIPPEDFFEILMFFKRYEVDTKQLQPYLTDEIIAFFSKNELQEFLTELLNNKAANAAA